MFLQTRKLKHNRQYLISIGLILLTAILCYLSVDFIGYRVVAFILLLVVSLLAMLFDIFPVLVTALLSALIWNFFFIPPLYNFRINTPEDGLMFLMYFVVALINAVLTYKIREMERKAREEDEKEKSIALYNTLLNSLSHELRTPIATIIGAIDTIQDPQTSLSDTNRTQLYSEIEIAACRLNRQVENLLNMSRLEAGVLQPSPDWCDLNELVYAVVDFGKGDATHHPIHFQPDDSLPLVKLDRGLLEQILYNLLHNALQHTPAETPIRISLSLEDEQCTLVVSDQGPGFPEEELALVFDKFYRLNNSRAGGSGLGLSIAKGFTEAMGGNIRLENQPGGGACFTVSLPVEVSTIKLSDHA